MTHVHTHPDIAYTCTTNVAFRISEINHQ